MVVLRSLAVIALMFLGAGRTAAQSPVSDSVWTIRGGPYDGMRVPIDLSRASRRGKFWRLTSVAGRQRIVGWNPSRLPVAVGFRHGLSISPADSAAFWGSLRAIESDMGMRLFHPVSLRPGEDPEDVVVVDIRPMVKDDGVTLVTWTAQGSVYDARIVLRSRVTMHNERVVIHEMMHALGFGHTMAWYSVMNPAARLDSRLSVEDIAHAQLALASRVTSEREDMWARLALAATREFSLTYSQCEELPVRSPEECTSFPCSVPSASCRAAQNTGPWPEH
jgi:hypothetical protein